MATTAMYCKNIISDVKVASECNGSVYGCHTYYRITTSFGVYIFAKRWGELSLWWTRSVQEEKALPDGYPEKEEKRSWEWLPMDVKEALYWAIEPEGSRERKNEFLFEPEEAKKRNEILLWQKAEEKKCSKLLPQDAERIYNELGRWDSVQFVKEYARKKGTGYVTRIFRVFIGEKAYEIDFSVECFSGGAIGETMSIKEIDIKAETKEKKEFGRKASSLAKKTGTPWSIASLLENPDWDGSAEALKKAKKIHETRLNKSDIHELCCGIQRRNEIISKLLGDYANYFRLKSQSRSRKMADYLLGDQYDD